MTREQMIEWLVNNDIDYVNGSRGGLEWLEHILRNGFDGYNNNTDDELRSEITERDPDFHNLLSGEQKCLTGAITL
jgi:hypothetical protein